MVNVVDATRIDTTVQAWRQRPQGQTAADYWADALEPLDGVVALICKPSAKEREKHRRPSWPDGSSAYFARIAASHLDE